MTSRTRLEAAAGILALAFCVYGVHEYRAERRARAAAEATAKAAQAQIVDAQHQRDVLARADASRDADAQKEIAGLQAQAAKAATPKQIVAYLNAELAKNTKLPVPVEIALPPVNQSLTLPPNGLPSATLSIPAPDLQPLRDLAVQAQQCAVELPVAKSDLSSCQTQLKLAGEQLSAAERQRDAYAAALKGGTWWHRTVHALKIFGIGAAAGAAAVCGSGHCK